MVRFDSEAVQAKIGTQFSLVGIDPRGVGRSGPSSDCFPGHSDIARNAFLTKIYDPADITSDYALRQNHEYLRSYGQWCSSVYAVNGTAKYASTVATAQDMLRYIELSAKSRGEPAEEAKLWYYGISYGTVLGGTFASLYPDRIGRMLIDGVMDMEDHYNGGWEKSITDGDVAARYFFKRCFEAGPTLCQFHQNATSWEELEQRYNELLRKLTDSPIAVGDLSSAAQAADLGIVLTPTIFKWQSLVNYMFTTSYILSPSSFTTMDQLLVEIQAGAGAFIAAASVDAQISSSFPAYDQRTARSLISCLDANRRFNTSEFPQYKAFVEQMYNTSVYGGLNTVYQSGPICSHLDVAPPKSQTFDGKSSCRFPDQRSDNYQGVPRVPSTSAPILLVSMLYDPVTPLPAARKMHSLFPGSGLLVGNNSGVCDFIIITSKSVKLTEFSTAHTSNSRIVCQNTKSSTSSTVRCRLQTQPVKLINPTLLLLSPSRPTLLPAFCKFWDRKHADRRCVLASIERFFRRKEWQVKLKKLQVGVFQSEQSVFWQCLRHFLFAFLLSFCCHIVTTVIVALTGSLLQCDFDRFLPLLDAAYNVLHDVHIMNALGLSVVLNCAV